MLMSAITEFVAGVPTISYFCHSSEVRSRNEGIEIVLGTRNLLEMFCDQASHVILFYWKMEPGMDTTIDLHIQDQHLDRTDGPDTKIKMAYYPSLNFVNPGSDISPLSETTRIISGYESGKRREVMLAGGSIEEYVFGDRPVFPEGMVSPWPS
jgi:hypothetical protein